MSASKAERQASAHTTTAEHERASPEKSEASARLPHFRVIIDQASVTPEVLHHKYRGQGTVESPYLVEFLSRDARDARKWSALKKWTITLTQATATLAVSFSSSAYSGGMLDVQKEFQIPRIEAVLGVSLFVLGFAVGPLLWAPFSELYGRQLLFFMTYMALTAFNAAAAGAQNMTTLAIMRFFAGAFGSSPLTNAGGVIADLFDASERGFAMPAFSMAPFLGPALGPIAGGFLTDSEGWRWVQGMVAIFTGLLWIAGALVCPETYQPVLLRRRAERLSKMTGKVYISKLDEGKKDLGLVPQLKIALSRPWIMLIKEPIVLFISIYMAIIYGTLFMCFAAFPIVYGETRGWSAGFSGLAFCGIVVGTVISVGWSLYDNKRYKKAAEAAGGHAAPEVRLPPAIIGSILIPVGEFWFAWTNGPQTHWLVSIVGTGIFSAGIVLVFLSLMNYLIDSYVIYAASVLAASSVLRALFATAFPLFTSYMYKDLGIHWASSIPAFLALACAPFPFFFWKYGEKIRLRCQFAAEAAKVLAKMQAQEDADGTDERASNDEGDGETKVSRVMTNNSNVLPV